MLTRIKIIAARMQIAQIRRGVFLVLAKAVMKATEFRVQILMSAPSKTNAMQMRAAKMKTDLSAAPVSGDMRATDSCARILTNVPLVNTSVELTKSASILWVLTGVNALMVLITLTLMNVLTWMNAVSETMIAETIQDASILLGASSVLAWLALLTRMVKIV